MPPRPTATVYERLAPDPRLIDRSLAGSAHQVFWLQDAPAPATGGPLSASHDADLTVVGAGYLGLWTALLAARQHPGARIVVLEAETVGWAASGRNGGFVEASLTHGELNGRNRWSAEYDALETMGQDNLDAFEADVDSLGLDCDWERPGSLEVAVEPHELSWLHEAEGSVVLDRQQVRAEIDSPVFLGGLWQKSSTALVHPGKLVRELARAAMDAGVQIHEHSPAVGLEASRSGPVTVRTARSTVTSEQVVLATNVFRSLVRRHRCMTVPVYDYVLMTEPLTGEQLRSIGWARRQGLADMANQFHYIRLSADNRILFGGYDAIYHLGGRVRAEYEDRPDSYRRLASHFLTMFPQLADVRFSHRWAGAIDTSTQFAAYFSLTHRGRVAHASGFTGLGVGATRFAAQVLLDRLSGADTERTRLQMVRRKPLRFPPEPIVGVGIQLTRRALDRADHRGGHRGVFLRSLDAVGLGFDS